MAKVEEGTAKKSRKSLIEELSRLMDEDETKHNQILEEAVSMVGPEHREIFRQEISSVDGPTDPAFLAFWESDPSCQMAAQKYLLFTAESLENFARIIREIAA